MKRHMKKIALWLAICLFIFPAAAPAAQTLTLSTVEGFTAIDAVTWILSRAYGELGIAIKVKKYSAQRAILEADLGASDGELFRIGGLSDDFPDLIMVDVPCYYFDVYLCTHREKRFEVDGWKSVPPGYTLAAPFGIKYLEQRIKTYHLKAVFTKFPKDAVGLILSGKADYTIATEELDDKVGVRDLNRDIIQLEPAVERVPAFHYLHKKHADLVPRIRKILLRQLGSGGS